MTTDDYRQLTPAESKVVEFLRQLNKLKREKRISIRIQMSYKAFEALKEENVCKPIKIESNDDENLCKLTLMVREFKKYVVYCCDRVGFVKLKSGEIVTFDGYKLPPVL